MTALYATLAARTLRTAMEAERQRRDSIEGWIRDANWLLFRLEDLNEAGERTPSPAVIRRVQTLTWRLREMGVVIRGLRFEGNGSRTQQALDYVLDHLMPPAMAIKHPWLPRFLAQDPTAGAEVTTPHRPLTEEDRERRMLSRAPMEPASIRWSSLRCASSTRSLWLESETRDRLLVRGDLIQMPDGRFSRAAS
jgi:hypothetical protein